jgi:hypothetical protein
MNWAASSGIAQAVGPLLSGVLLGHSGWQAVFMPNAVLGVITLLVAVPFAAECLASGGRLDIPGALLGTVTIASVVYALIQGGRDGYTAAPVVAAGSWPVDAAAFVAVELRVAAPMLDIKLFASRSFSAVMVIAAVALIGFTGVAVLREYTAMAPSKTTAAIAEAAAPIRIPRTTRTLLSVTVF